MRGILKGNNNKTVVIWDDTVCIYTTIMISLHLLSRCFFSKRNPKKNEQGVFQWMIFALPRSRSQNQILPHPRFILQRSVCCGFSRLGPCTTKSTGRFRLYTLFLLGYLACIGIFMKRGENIHAFWRSPMGAHSQESRSAVEQQGILVVNNPFINPCF